MCQWAVTSPTDAERQETQKEGAAGKQRVATGPLSISEDSPALPPTKHFALIPAAKVARTCCHTDLINVMIRTKTRVSGDALCNLCGVSGQVHVQPW